MWNEKPFKLLHLGLVGKNLNNQINPMCNTMNSKHERNCLFTNLCGHTMTLIKTSTPLEQKQISLLLISCTMKPP